MNECLIGLPACELLTLGRLGREARAYGVAKLARELGVSRQVIYRGFRDGGNPLGLTVLRACKIMSLHPHVEPIAKEKSPTVKAGD